MKLLFPMLVVLVAASAAGAQQPVRWPLAYVSGTVAAQPISYERVLLARARLEVPAGARTRPWLEAGTWGFTGTTCMLGRVCGDHGALVGAGVDATPLGPASPVQPFIGIGYEAYFAAGVKGRQDEALVHAGADTRLSRWAAFRAEAELLTFHRRGAPVLLSAGLRLSVPGR